ncbi:MAG: glutathione peroxidase [Chitinophagales bacterium]
MATKSVFRKLKKTLIVLLMLIVAFWGYVEIVNRNSKHMTYRQKILKAIYPAWMWWTKLNGKNVTELSNEKMQPPVSFYSLKDTLNNGSEFDFSELKGKKVLLVNTASDCGYTNQYNDLQQLYEQHKNDLVVIGFPANDFKQQEKGTDEEIAQFCKQNYSITFPLMRKTMVIKKEGQNKVFRWLTDSAQNGWNTKPPSWNFCKYLVNENGVLTNYFGSSVSPMSKDVLDAINKK